MDGLPHYSTNVISTSAASYPSPPAVAPHQLQQGSSLPQTLPPLQPNNLVMQQPNYGSYPNTPRTTPNTPVSAGMASYPPPPPQNGGRSNYQMMANNPYQQPQQAYATSSAMLPQTTTAASHPQPIAPAPAAGGRVPPMLRPMPASGVVQQQPGMNSPYAQSPLMPQQPMLPEGEQPTHVVGSQGRRGILPSAPGKPAAPQAGTASGKPQVPQKDADGKFPCPHCTKTYLHAKHLKRHLLRHTGDRPYMCVLCRDTFSRSDILKRHFQKCSIRRGNPTGASHLSHPQAHVKKNAAAQQKAMGAEGDVNHINGMGNIPADGMVTHHPFGIISTPASDGMNTIANDQSQLSRSSSMNRLDDANRDRRNMTGQGVGQGVGQTYNGDVSNSMSANINPQLANYSMPQNQNGIPIFGGSNSTDWSQMFQPGAQTTYVTSSFAPNVRQTQTAIKQEPEPDATHVNSMAGAPPSADPALAISWGIPSTFPDAYEQLSTKIINFFYQAGIAVEPTTTGIVDQYFQPDNIKDFLKQYTHFHGHFTILHIPTFRALEAYVGLVAAMCCIGGCYSDRVSAANVRDMMNFLKAALEASSHMFASLLNDANSVGTRGYGNFGSNKTDIEELQAIMLTETLFLWHGTPLQRETGRRTFPLIAALAHRAGLLRVSADASLFSPMHQPGSSTQAFSASNFDWMTWVEQEKRIRIMYLIFLCDASLGLYFNTGPEFDTFEIHLPLPSDDAAWDASTARECAEALGLHGPEAAKSRNPDGTQRCNQPEMHLVMKALLDSSYQIQPGATNLYGKFILIHALLAMMRRVQLDGSGVLSKGSSTPLPQNAWFVGVQNRTSAESSARGTPVDVGGNLIDNRTMKMFWTALDKFKIAWDNDMAAQFLRSTVTHARRYGFSKDGIHFYWLATYLLKNTQIADLQAAPDQRFCQIIQLLKSVKDWVLTDGASRGEELGSVGEIDCNYGVSYLTLDMAQLFKPLQKVMDLPTTIPVQAGSGNISNIKSEWRDNTVKSEWHD